MSKKENKKDLILVVLFLCIVFLLVLTACILYKKTHPDFDEKISGKEAIVVSEVAIIHYDEPLGRKIDAVTKSQKVILTGKKAHFLQSDIPMVEIRLENDTLAWIAEEDIAISE